MFRITMLPAAYGDSLLLEYGEDSKPPRRVLIDAGTAGTYKPLAAQIASLPERERQFELFVITHVDSDHIGGAVKLMANRAKLGLTFRDIWFNGYVHLDPEFNDVLGPIQGEKVTHAIVDQTQSWNKAFGQQSVVVPETGKLPVKKLPGGLTLTLLSPTWTELERLRPTWEKVVRKAGLEPGKPATRTPSTEHDDLLGPLDVQTLAMRPFKSDTTEANASSIVLLAEYDGERILLGGDAQVPVLTRTLPRLPKAVRGRIRWCKLPHHGSRANLNAALLDLLGSERFLVSTNGKIYKHPDKEAIARILVHGQDRHLYFNYRTEHNEMWDDATLMHKHKYQPEYSADNASGLTVDLKART